MSSSIQHSPQQNRAILQILIACSIWALSFIFTKWCLVYWDPFWLICVRFYIPAFISFLLILVFFKKNFHKADVLTALAPGLMLGSNVILWTFGLKHTTVVNSGFISVLYVLIVPFFTSLIYKKKLPFLQWMFIFVGVFGVLLMCDVTQLQRMNRGDAYTLAGSFTAASHILLTEAASHKIRSAFVYNAFQAFFAATVALFFVFILQRDFLPLAPWTHIKPWFGFVGLSLGTVFIANFLQVKAQKHISSTTTSLFFLMEAPIAAFLGYLWLDEVITMMQLLGAAFVFAAVLGTVRTNRKL